MSYDPNLYYSNEGYPLAKPNNLEDPNRTYLRNRSQILQQSQMNGLYQDQYGQWYDRNGYYVADPLYQIELGKPSNERLSYQEWINQGRPQSYGNQIYGYSNKDAYAGNYYGLNNQPNIPVGDYYSKYGYVLKHENGPYDWGTYAENKSKILQSAREKGLYQDRSDPNEWYDAKGEPIQNPLYDLVYTKNEPIPDYDWWLAYQRQYGETPVIKESKKRSKSPKPKKKAAKRTSRNSGERCRDEKGRFAKCD